MTAAQLSFLLAAIFVSRFLSERACIWLAYLFLLCTCGAWVARQFFNLGGA